MSAAEPAPFADAPPRVQVAIISLSVIVGIAGVVGTALLPSLSVHHPMALLALAPNYLGLVAPRVEFSSAYPLVALRRVIGMLAIYGIGGLYGEAALRTLSTKSPRVGRALRWLSHHFRRYGVAFLVALPGVSVSMVAGVSGMAPRRFIPAAIVGQFLWTYLYFRFSLAIGAFTERALRFMERHLLAASVVFVLGVFAQQLHSRRRARREELARREAERSA